MSFFVETKDGRFITKYIWKTEPGSVGQVIKNIRLLTCLSTQWCLQHIPTSLIIPCKDMIRHQDVRRNFISSYRDISKNHSQRWSKELLEEYRSTQCTVILHYECTTPKSRDLWIINWRDCCVPLTGRQAGRQAPSEYNKNWGFGEGNSFLNMRVIQKDLKQW